MKEIFFLLLVSIIATQKECSAVLNVSAVVNKVGQAVLGTNKDCFELACKIADKTLQAYYDEKLGDIRKLLFQNADCDKDKIDGQLKALDSAIKLLKENLLGKTEDFEKNSQDSLNQIDGKFKDLDEVGKNLTDECKQKLKGVFEALLRLQTRITQTRSDHILTVKAYLKTTGSLLGN